MEPIYFVVERRHGKEVPSICYERMTSYLTRKVTPFEQSPIVYVLRIDKLPNAEWWLLQPLDVLYTYYKALRKANKLPVMT